MDLIFGLSLPLLIYFQQAVKALVILQVCAGSSEPLLLILMYHIYWERSGSMVKCLTPHRWVMGLSITVVVLEQDTFILA